MDASVTPTVTGKETLTRGVLLSQQFCDHFRAEFNKAQRKKRADTRQFVLPMTAYWEWLVSINELTEMPDGPDLTKTERHGLRLQASAVATLIRSASGNPANVTPIYPHYRLIYNRSDRSTLLVQLIEAYVLTLNAEPMQRASKFIDNQRKLVRRHARWAKANPEMPNSQIIASTAELADGVMEELGTCLVNIAKRVSRYRLPPPAPVMLQASPSP